TLHHISCVLPITPPPPTSTLFPFTTLLRSKTKSGERFTETLLANEVMVQLLEPDGVFILEKRPAEALSEMKLWRLVRQKAYGATEILFLSAVRNPKSTIQQ